MQTTKLFAITALATLLLCSALSVAAAQQATLTPQPGYPSTASTTAPQQGAPVEGNQSASGVSDLAPIYEHNGEPAFGIPSNKDGPAVTSQPQAQLYSGTPAGNSSQDGAWLAVAVGIVLAVAVGGAIGVVYFHKQAKTQN